MSDAPNAIWIDLERIPSRHTCSPSEATPHDVKYIRADMSDALLREAMGALDDRDGGSHDADCKSFWSWAPNHCNCGHERARATLAKLRAHLGEKE